MQITYKNKLLERTLIGVNSLTAAVVAASFVVLFGFDEPLLPRMILSLVQFVLLCIFIGEKIIRFFNAVSKKEFLQANWFEIPLLLALGTVVFGADRWFGQIEPARVRHASVGIYLILQVNNHKTAST